MMMVTVMLVMLVMMLMMMMMMMMMVMVMEIGEVKEEAQAIIFCTYIYSSGPTIDDIQELKLVFKAKGGDTVLPVCYMTLGEKGSHTGITCLAIYRSGGGWKVKNVYSKGSGPDHSDMIPACEALFS